jgi:hypothetical protein
MRHLNTFKGLGVKVRHRCVTEKVAKAEQFRGFTAMTHQAAVRHPKWPSVQAKPLK